MVEQVEITTTSAWWGQRRLRYNIGLVVAGLLAFVTYASLVFTFEDRIENVDITIFTTAFQAIGYLVAMGLANICYLLGPISERIIKPRDVTKYRNITFRLGFWFSVLLPFSIPMLVVYKAVTNG
jgi:hypothetical protein